MPVKYRASLTGLLTTLLLSGHDEVLEGMELTNPVIVSPDAGGVERARAYAKRLNIVGYHRQAESRTECC